MPRAGVCLLGAVVLGLMALQPAEAQVVIDTDSPVDPAVFIDDNVSQGQQ